MEPKKSPKADLESKRFIFFLFGIALSLVGAIIVFQHKTPFAQPAVPQEPETIIYTTELPPITKREEPELPKQKEEMSPTDKTDPEPQPDPKLDITDLTGDEPEGPEEELVPIKYEGGDDLDEIETVPPIMLERIARPVECENLNDGDAQRRCLNDWIKRYVKEHVDYPDLARKLNQEARVYVSFIIDENGYVDKVKVARPGYELLDEEAKRVIESLPKFIPGSQHGRQVRMQMTVPINFRKQ